MSKFGFWTGDPAGARVQLGRSVIVGILAFELRPKVSTLILTS